MVLLVKAAPEVMGFVTRYSGILHSYLYSQRNDKVTSTGL